MINYENFSLLTAFMIGLTGNFHCIGMCTGIITVFSMSLSKEKKKYRYLYQIYYNLGRILGYTFITTIAFNIGLMLIHMLGIKNLYFLKLISGLTLIILSFYLLNISNLIKIVENLGFKIWNNIKTYIKIFFPIKNPIQALLLGIIWSHVPCGLFYSTMIWSISSASFYKSISLIIAFGIGTLPSMLGIFLFSNNIKNYIMIKKICGFIFLFIGLYDIYMYLLMQKCH